MKRIVAIVCLALLSVGVSGQKSATLGDNAPKKQMVKFFPNPAVSLINFEFSSQVSPGYTLEVYSFLGRRMITTPVSGSRLSLNITDLFRGIYVFQLKDKEGRVVETNKFQVSK